MFLFGLVIGSFLNCLIWRLRQGEGMWGRSYCPKCRAKILWYDNIPILSFILLGGRCRHCAKSISWQYPMVELITGIFFLLAWYKNIYLIDKCYESCVMSYVDLFRDWFLIAVMIVIFVYDLRWYLILDVVTLPACVVVLILNLILGFNWYNLIISGIIGSSFFLVQFAISKGKWIGGGDIRLGLLMGLALGWPNILVAIFLAYFIGSIVGISLILLGKKQWGSQVPLGVFLSIATIITMLWGSEILGWYMGYFEL